jgi:hypothetical protein
MKRQVKEEEKIFVIHTSEKILYPKYLNSSFKTTTTKQNQLSKNVSKRLDMHFR